MTNKNDANNWMVISLGGKSPVMVCSDQAENVARAAAETYANKFPNVPVGLYKREAVVVATTAIKWE